MTTDTQISVTDYLHPVTCLVNCCNTWLKLNYTSFKIGMKSVCQKHILHVATRFIIQVVLSSTVNSQFVFLDQKHKFYSFKYKSVHLTVVPGTLQPCLTCTLYCLHWSQQVNCGIFIETEEQLIDYFCSSSNHYFQSNTKLSQAREQFSIAYTKTCKSIT